MNLTGEKKKPLREQTVVNKKKMLMMHYKKSSYVSLHLYLNTKFDLKCTKLLILFEIIVASFVLLFMEYISIEISLI